jgi:hypothetical protein
MVVQRGSGIGWRAMGNGQRTLVIERGDGKMRLMTDEEWREAELGANLWEGDVGPNRFRARGPASRDG